MAYTQRLTEANLLPSVGSAGDSYDNALAETINGLDKAGVIWRQRSWSSASAVEMATLRWVDWFNNHRRFARIGYITPAETEANYYAALETSIWLRNSSETASGKAEAAQRGSLAGKRDFPLAVTPKWRFCVLRATCAIAICT